MKQLVLSLLVLLIAAGVNANAASPGYLPVVGPPSLRFAAPRLAEKKVEPPAPAPTTEATPPAKPAPIVVESPKVDEAPAAVTNPPPALVAGPVEPEPADTTPTEPPPPPPGIDAVMPQPQLFLQYFTPDYVPATNGYTVVLPVGFLPPQPRNPGSSARYQVTPPEKK